jgi:hypothetical protein
MRPFVNEAKVRVRGCATSAYVLMVCAARHAAIGDARFTVRKEVVICRLSIGVETR